MTSLDTHTGEITGIRIDDVIVGDRARKDYGDLAPLMDSIREHGLLQPIGVLRGNRLLFGGRRLEACRRLGRVTISMVRPETQDDALSLLKAERDENTCRKDMTLSEKVEIGRRIEELERPKARERQALAGQHHGRGIASDQSIGSYRDDRPNPDTREVVGDALGLSTATYSRAKQVVDAAADESLPPEVLEIAQDAAREMDSTGSAWAASQKVKQAKAEAAQPAEKPEPKRPGPQLVPQIIKAANIRRIAEKLSGYHEALNGITAADPKLTNEEATRITGDLSKSIAALQRLNRLIKERTK